MVRLERILTNHVRLVTIAYNNLLSSDIGFDQFCELPNGDYLYCDEPSKAIASPFFVHCPIGSVLAERQKALKLLSKN